MSLKIVINLSNNFKNYPELQNQHHHHRPCKSSSLTTLGQAVFKPLAYLFPSAVPFSTPATHSTSDPLPLPLSGPILYPSKHSTRVPVTPYLFPSAGHSLPQQHTVPVTPYLFPSAVPFSTPATHSTSDPLPLPLSGPILYPSNTQYQWPLTSSPQRSHSLPQQHTIPVTPYLFPSAVPFSTPATHSTSDPLPLPLSSPILYPSNTQYQWPLTSSPQRSHSLPQQHTVPVTPYLYPSVVPFSTPATHSTSDPLPLPLSGPILYPSNTQYQWPLTSSPQRSNSLPQQHTVPVTPYRFPSAVPFSTPATHSTSDPLPLPLSGPILYPSNTQYQWPLTSSPQRSHSLPQQHTVPVTPYLFPSAVPFFTPATHSTSDPLPLPLSGPILYPSNTQYQWPLTSSPQRSHSLPQQHTVPVTPYLFPSAVPFSTPATHSTSDPLPLPLSGPFSTPATHSTSDPLPLPLSGPILYPSNTQYQWPLTSSRQRSHSLPHQHTVPVTPYLFPSAVPFSTPSTHSTSDPLPLPLSGPILYPSNTQYQWPLTSSPQRSHSLPQQHTVPVTPYLFPSAVPFSTPATHSTSDPLPLPLIGPILYPSNTQYQWPLTSTPQRSHSLPQQHTVPVTPYLFPSAVPFSTPATHSTSDLLPLPLSGPILYPSNTQYQWPLTSSPQRSHSLPQQHTVPVTPYLFPSAVPFSTPATHSTSDPLPLPLSGPILYPSNTQYQWPLTSSPQRSHSLPQQHTVPVTPYLFPSAVPFSTPATHSTSDPTSTLSTLFSEEWFTDNMACLSPGVESVREFAR